MGDSLAVAEEGPARRIDPGAEGPLQKAGPTTPMQAGRARAALEALARSGTLEWRRGTGWTCPFSTFSASGFVAEGFQVFARWLEKDARH